MIAHGNEPHPTTLINFFGAELDDYHFYHRSCDFSNYLPGTLLVKTDRISMHNSLEVRCPFLSNDMIDFAVNLPDSLCLSNSSKPLLRTQLSRYVPSEVFTRPKHGFSTPLEKWLNITLPAYQHLFSQSYLIKQDIFNPLAVHQLLAQHNNRARSWHYQIWNLLSFQIWYDNKINYSSHI